MDAAKIVEMREAGFTWNQIDEMLLPAEKLVRSKTTGKIVSQAFKFAKKKGLDAAFSKMVIGAYTATQIVVPLRKFNPHAPKTEKVEMVHEFAM